MREALKRRKGFGMSKAMLFIIFITILRVIMQSICLGKGKWKKMIFLLWTLIDDIFSFNIIQIILICLLNEFKINLKSSGKFKWIKNHLLAHHLDFYFLFLFIYWSTNYLCSILSLNPELNILKPPIFESYFCTLLQ